MKQNFGLRPALDSDIEFLYRLYAATREAEMNMLQWTDQQKQQFLQMQFNAQDKYYQEQFPKAAFQIILLREEPIGRLYLDRRSDEIRIIDIALLPEQRNKGVGSKLLKEILKEGQRVALPIRIHVEQFNPALRLYTRLGFKKISDNGVYYLMEWSPQDGRQDEIP